MARKAKTTGKEWLYYSLMAFNGSGYADMTSAQNYLNSYIAYKTGRHKKQAVTLAKLHGEDLYLEIEKLLAKTNGANRKPPQKYLNKVRAIQAQQEAQGKLF